MGGAAEPLGLMGAGGPSTRQGGGATRQGQGINIGAVEAARRGTVQQVLAQAKDKRQNALWRCHAAALFQTLTVCTGTSCHTWDIWPGLKKSHGMRDTLWPAAATTSPAFNS